MIIEYVILLYHTIFTNNNDLNIIQGIFFLSLCIIVLFIPFKWNEAKYAPTTINPKYICRSFIIIIYTISTRSTELVLIYFDQNSESPLGLRWPPSMYITRMTNIKKSILNLQFFFHSYPYPVYIIYDMYICKIIFPKTIFNT